MPSNPIVRRPRILIVDNDDAIREVLAQVLAREGYLVEIESDAKAGAAAALARPPDLLVLDLQLGGTNGDAVFKHLRAQPATSGLPILICTVGRHETIRRMLGVEPPHVLFKPFTVAALLEAVRHALGAPSL